MSFEDRLREIEQKREAGRLDATNHRSVAMNDWRRRNEALRKLGPEIANAFKSRRRALEKLSYAPSSGAHIRSKPVSGPKGWRAANALLGVTADGVFYDLFHVPDRKGRSGRTRYVWQPAIESSFPEYFRDADYRGPDPFPETVLDIDPDGEVVIVRPQDEGVIRRDNLADLYLNYM